MQPSPNLTPRATPVTFAIIVANAPLSPQVQVESIDISTTSGEVTRASIVIAAGSQQGSLHTGDDLGFLPGIRVQIRVGYNTQVATLFDGQVVSQGLQIAPATSPALSIALVADAPLPAPSATYAPPSLTLTYGASILDCNLQIGASLTPQAGAAQWKTASGTVAFQGSAAAPPGATIALANLGSAFNGNYLVSAVHHKITASNWQTTATVKRILTGK